MKIALVQTRTPATPEAARDHVLPLVREAARLGAELIATPEGVNVLQKDKDRLLPLLRPLEDDLVVRALREAARELGVTILIGSALVLRQDGKAANRQALITPAGEIAATYDKLHMFDVDLPNGESARESATYEPGDRAVVAEACGAKLGLTICYDVRFPALHRQGALGGAVARPRHRDRQLRAGPGPGRLPRGRPWHLGPFACHRPLGRGDGAS
jgi:predicted amidohydrolase